MCKSLPCKLLYHWGLSGWDVHSGMIEGASSYISMRAVSHADTTLVNSKLQAETLLSEL